MMHEIGTIKQVQIQCSSLKVGERNQQHYDPAPLLVVSRLLLTSGGCIGIKEDGKQIIDVHHQDHPTSRRRAENAISFGFTSHYRAMRNNFGQHLSNGIAGENILIEADKEFTIDELPHGIAIQGTTSGELTYLVQIEIATPCLPFSQFAAQGTSLQVKESLQFLNDGRRGFYVTQDARHSSAEVKAGERVFAL